MSGSIVFEFAKGLCWHAVRMATFRGTPKEVPSSSGLLLLLMALSIMLGLTEQLARGKGLAEAIWMTGLWVGFVFLCSFAKGKPDVRLTSAMFLAALPIQAALALAGLLQAPALEWLVALWGGAAILLLTEKARRGA
jgi:hypothetical protein